MNITMLKGKIHRATVTQAELNYVGTSLWMQICWTLPAFWNMKRYR